MIACRALHAGDAGAGAHLVAREVDRSGERKDLVVAFRRDHGAVGLVAAARIGQGGHRAIEARQAP